MTPTDLIARLRYTAEHGTLAAIDAGMDADPALVGDAMEGMIAEVGRLRKALGGLLGATEEIGYVHYAPFRTAARAALEEHHD